VELTQQVVGDQSCGAIRTRLRRLVPEDRAQRALAFAIFVNTSGSGVVMTTSALYFTQMVGLTVDRYAIGLLIGSSVGLTIGLFAGRAADRFGARTAQIVLMLGGAIGMICFLFVTDFWQFVLAYSWMSSVYAGSTSTQAPLIRALGSANPTRLRAYIISVTNLAIALGALAGGAAIAAGTREAYLSVFAGRAAAFLGAACLLTRVPGRQSASAPKAAGRWQVVRDRPYLLATVLNGLMSIHFAVPTVLLPLWIATYTAAPRWVVSVAFLLNTAIIVCLQVPVSGRVEDCRSASRRMLWAGLAIAGGLSVIAASSGRTTLAATALLLLGIAVYTIGELWQSAASMEYSFGLAAPHAQGAYSGVFGLGSGVGQAVGPMVVGVMALHWAGPGLIGLGLCFTVVGAACQPLLTLGMRRWPRERHEGN
jgi:MFS family permease